MKRMSWLSLVRHKVVTDARQMRTELGFYYVVLILATGMCLLWPGPRGSGQTPFIDILNGIAVLYPLLLTVAVILRDPPSVVAAFWQGRPVTRRALLTSKSVFLGLAVMLPPLLCVALVALRQAGPDATVTVSANLTGWALWWILLAAAAAAWSGTPVRMAYAVVGVSAVLFLAILLEEMLRQSAAGPMLTWVRRAGSSEAALPWLLALVLGAFLRPSRRVLIVILICGLPVSMMLYRAVDPDRSTARGDDVPDFTVEVQGDRILHLTGARGDVFLGLTASLEVQDLPSPCFAVLGESHATLVEDGRERRSHIDHRDRRRAYEHSGWRSAYETEHERAPWTLRALFEGAEPCNIHEWSVRHAPLATLFRYGSGKPISEAATLRADLEYDVFRFEQVGNAAPLASGAPLRAPGLTIRVTDAVPNRHHVKVTVDQRMLNPDLWPILHNPALVLVWPERKIVCPSVGETYLAGASLGPVHWWKKTLRFGNLGSLDGGLQLLEPDALAEAELRLVNRIHVGTRTVRLEQAVSHPEAAP